MSRLAQRLTDTIAKRLPQPASGYVLHWCKDTSGFGVRITHAGVRTWVFERRVDGRSVRRGLGRVPGSGRNAITAEAARKAAQVLSNELALGIDSAANRREAEKKEERTGIKFEDALRQYVKDDSARKRPLKQRTTDDYLAMIRPSSRGENGRSRVEGELAPIANRRLDALTGGGVKSLYKTLQKRGPVRAAYAMRVLRGVLNYHGVRLPEDPFDRTTARRERIVLPSANRRDRVIPPERLHAWWNAASAAPNGDYFQLLLLTGLRRGELSAVRVSDVDLTGGRVAIADTKNHKPHIVLLGSQARKIVASRVGKRPPVELLFESVADPRKSLRKIIKASGVEFSAHDCRRTFGSIAASLLPGYVVKRLMNHGHGNDVTGAHYVNLDEGALRDGWQKVADFIASQSAATSPKVGRRRISKLAE